MSKTPIKFEIKRLSPEDFPLFTKLIGLFHGVFAMKNFAPGKESYLRSLLANSTFIAYVAIHNNEIVGGITAYELPMYYSQCSEVFIYDLAVKSDYQRNGIGKSLLSSLKEYCVNRGIHEIFVSANDEDKEALDFYRACGGKPEQAVHFNYIINP
jgi:aminoglycoside 3-N-acetyltransferase I